MLFGLQPIFTVRTKTRDAYVVLFFNNSFYLFCLSFCQGGFCPRCKYQNSSLFHQLLSTLLKFSTLSSELSSNFEEFIASLNPILLPAETESTDVNSSSEDVRTEELITANPAEKENAEKI